MSLKTSENKLVLLDYYLDDLDDTNTLLFQVVEQSDKLTNYIKARGSYTANNGWKVQISHMPEIDISNKIIYLQGDESEYDHRMDTHEDLKGAKDVRKAVDKALEEVCRAAKNWEPRQSLNFNRIVVVRPTFNPFNLFNRDRNINIYFDLD